MKKCIQLTVVIFLISNLSYAQSWQLRTSPTDTPKQIVDGTVAGDFSNPVTKLDILLSEDSPKTYIIKIGEAEKGTMKSDGVFYPIDFGEDIRGKTIDIYDGTNSVNSFILSTQRSPDNPTTLVAPKAVIPLKTATQELQELFPTFNITDFGIQIPGGNANTKYTGDKYVHMFFDQNGNSLLTTIPQGISNMQYVVHIFYLSEKANPNRIDYAVKQTKGKFEGTIVFNNTGGFGDFEFRSGEGPTAANFYWAHKEILLSTSTTDIEFEIIRSEVKQSSDFTDIQKTTLNTYTIQMSKVYHGTFEIGLFNSTLSNPDYELVQSPNNPDELVVKKGNSGNRGLVTAMATFYASPVIIIQKLFGKDIPKYKLTGRNFLDDHKVYERFYPSIGISLSKKSFENLFLGITWEFARGGSIWGGGHYGKINTYETYDGFEFGATVVSQAEYNLRKDKDWEVNWAFGLNLDIRLVTNLFK